jgi:hypothetical protein
LPDVTSAIVRLFVRFVNSFIRFVLLGLSIARKIRKRIAVNPRTIFRRSAGDSRERFGAIQGDSLNRKRLQSSNWQAICRRFTGD